MPGPAPRRRPEPFRVRGNASTSSRNRGTAKYVKSRLAVPDELQRQHRASSTSRSRRAFARPTSSTFSRGRAYFAGAAVPNANLGTASFRDTPGLTVIVACVVSAAAEQRLGSTLSRAKRRRRGIRPPQIGVEAADQGGRRGYREYVVTRAGYNVFVLFHRDRTSVEATLEPRTRTAAGPLFPAYSALFPYMAAREICERAASS